MFYFDTINNKKILRSDYLSGVNAFFTTRDGFDFGVLNASRVITPVQTHSDHVEIADERPEYPDTDGVILSEQGVALYLRFADCTPLIFYDSENKIGAVSHAGWRGTAQKIGVKTVRKMSDSFGSKPENIIAVIGPAISMCCYEVSEDVKNLLSDTVENKECLCSGNNVDLKGINARQLEEIGLEKIDICPYCTSCNNDLFYSYRKENGTKSRHFAVLKL